MAACSGAGLTRFRIQRLKTDPVGVGIIADSTPLYCPLCRAILLLLYLSNAVSYSLTPPFVKVRMRQDCVSLELYIHYRAIIRAFVFKYRLLHLYSTTEYYITCTAVYLHQYNTRYKLGSAEIITDILVPQLNMKYPNCQGRCNFQLPKTNVQLLSRPTFRTAVSTANIRDCCTFFPNKTSIHRG